jgi:hypothetical protein
LTGDHCDSYHSLRVAELRPGFIALGATALAIRMGVSRRTAERMMERTLARQHDPAVLRVVRLPVRVGKGAQRAALHLLWPVG